MMKKLIYIAGGNVSVLESQVLELLKFYHIKGIPLALIMGYRNTNEKGKLKRNYPIIHFWMSYGLNHILHIKYSNF